MKHVIVIETVGSIGPSCVDELHYKISRIADALTRENQVTVMIGNQSSAIRGVYWLYGANESKSPDQLQSAK